MQERITRITLAVEPPDVLIQPPYLWFIPIAFPGNNALPQHIVFTYSLTHNKRFDIFIFN